MEPNPRKEIEDLRRVMGTLPNQSPEKGTRFLRGVEGLSVELVDWPTNPYKAMYIMATSCWGDKINKWHETSPENRFRVVDAVLKRQALPLALESFSLTFVIEGISRAGFDQLARTRIGAVFSAKGMRDNNWKACNIRIPNALWPTPTEFDLANSSLSDMVDELGRQHWAEAKGKVDRFNSICQTMLSVKDTYSDIVDSGKASWQAARTVLPLYVCYGYSAAYNFNSLLGVCANRMKFCEMEDVVATAWLMRAEVQKKFPFLASYLKPGCDNGGVCQYHKSYTLSEMFGCLFSECGRNPCPDSNGYAEFNETCTDRQLLIDQLGIEVPTPSEWTKYPEFKLLPYSDQELFRAD